MTQLITIKGVNTRFEESAFILSKATSLIKIQVRKGLDTDYSEIQVYRNGKLDMTTTYPNDKVDEFIASVKHHSKTKGYTEVIVNGN